MWYAKDRHTQLLFWTPCASSTARGCPVLQCVLIQKTTAIMIMHTFFCQLPKIIDNLNLIHGCSVIGSLFCNTIPLIIIIIIGRAWRLAVTHFETETCTSTCLVIFDQYPVYYPLWFLVCSTGDTDTLALLCSAREPVLTVQNLSPELEKLRRSKLHHKVQYRKPVLATMIRWFSRHWISGQ